MLKRGENYKDLIGANFFACGVINKYQKNKSDFVFIKKNKILINFDGRIDNTVLLKTLVGANSSKNINDAELIYLLYKKMGIGFLERIRGPFAVVINDLSSNTLICARDHLGINLFIIIFREKILFMVRNQDLYLCKKILTKS